MSARKVWPALLTLSHCAPEPLATWAFDGRLHGHRSDNSVFGEAMSKSVSMNRICKSLDRNSDCATLPCARQLAVS